MNRITHNLRFASSGHASTPWGQADTATEYAPGIVFYTTPSHGGFYLSPQRLATMPEPYRSHPTFCRQPNWYEEDCDWAAVALAFPQFFTADELTAATRSWQWMTERKAKDQDAKDKAYALTAARMDPEFNEADCGGAFDGFQVTSDTDPGL